MQAYDVLSLRLRLKETQAAFAERFGVNQSTVARWEKDGLPDRGTTRRTIERFAEELARAS